MCFVPFSSYGFCIWNRSYCTKGFRKSLILAVKFVFYLFYVNTKEIIIKYKNCSTILAVIIILGFLITAVLQGYQLQRIDSWLKPLK